MFSSRARQVRKTLTDAERRLWSVLRSRQLGGHKFRRQHPFECYVLDFACVEAKLAVEADGGQHGGTRDDRRDAALEANGWRVLRFANNDILGNIEGVAETILEALSRSAGERGPKGRVREPETSCSLAPSPSHAAHGSLPLPQGGRGEYADIDAALAEHGLMARGGLHSEEYPTLILAGSAGSSFWPYFAAERQDEPHPLDSWTRRTLAAIAGRFGARVLMACDGPPFLPFQRWAMAAEPVYSSPMGVLVHPEYGLWHSYRGALVFDRIVDLPQRPEAPSPCEACVERPCAKGCPVSAAVPYDVPRCLGHLKAEGECRSLGCGARHACPLGQAFAYTPDHAAFHMEAFVNAVWA